MQQFSGDYTIYFVQLIISWSYYKQWAMARGSAEFQCHAYANVTAILSYNVYLWICLFPNRNVQIFGDNVGATYLTANLVFLSP